MGVRTGLYWLKTGTKDGFGNMTMSVSVPKNIKYFGYFNNCRFFKKLSI
jgi:hypothetical protein